MSDKLQVGDWVLLTNCANKDNRKYIGTIVRINIISSDFVWLDHPSAVDLGWLRKNLVKIERTDLVEALYGK